MPVSANDLTIFPAILARISSPPWFPVLSSLAFGQQAQEVIAPHLFRIHHFLPILPTAALGQALIMFP